MSESRRAARPISDEAVEEMKQQVTFGSGYKRPPEATRFKKGQSGNPKGRPKRVTTSIDDRSAAALTLREAERIIQVRDGEVVRPMMQIEAILRSQYVSASKGSAYAQKHIIERYDRAERERRVALEARNEQWRQIVDRDRKLLELAKKNGEAPPEFLPHPDDVEIDPDRGVIFHGPFDQESLRRVHETCAFRDALILQDALDVRDIVTTAEQTPLTTAFFCAGTLNDLLPERFRLTDFEFMSRVMKLYGVTKRQLRPMLRRAWADLGVGVPSEKSMPPLADFLEMFGAVADAYSELEATSKRAGA